MVCSDPRGGSTCRPLEGVRKDYHCIACSATGKPVIFASRSISASGISLAEISASLCGARCFSSSFLSACTSQNISAQASLFTPGRTRGFVKPEGNKKSPRKRRIAFAKAMISRGPTSLSRDFPGTQPAVNGSHRAGISPRPLRDAFPHPLTKEAFSRWPPLSAVRPDRYFFPSQRFLYYMHFPLICKYFFRRAFFRRGGVRFALLRLGERKLASAWGVVPGRELPSALGHNEDVFGPAFFKKLAERETASRDLIRLPKRKGRAPKGPPGKFL